MTGTTNEITTGVTGGGWRATVEAAFDAILEQTTQTYRREILAKIPDGVYVWEDYAEHSASRSAARESGIRELRVMIFSADSLGTPWSHSLIGGTMRPSS